MRTRTLRSCTPWDPRVGHVQCITLIIRLAGRSYIQLPFRYTARRHQAIARPRAIKSAVLSLAFAALATGAAGEALPGAGAGSLRQV